MIDQKKIDELKSAHPGVKLHQLTPKMEDGEPYVIDGREVVFVVKAPTRAQWKRFKTEIQEASKRASATDTLSLDCVVYPPRQEFERVLEELPAISSSLSGELSELGGIAEKFEKKEL